jgi:DNA-binding NtrC family response regulator
VVAGDRALAGVLCEELRARGHFVAASPTLAHGLESLAEDEFDVAVADLALPDGDGLALLARACEDGLLFEVLALADAWNVPAALEAMRRGAYDYVVKPARMDEVEVLVAKAASRRRLRREALSRPAQPRSLDPATEALTTDPAMRAVVQAAERAADADAPLLIEGERGVGKAHLARLLHRRSPRAEAPFLIVDCASPQGERDVFGAAGNGDRPSQPGAIGLAAGGTLFLGSLGVAGRALQDRVLEVLATGEYSPAGGSRRRRCRARLVCGSRLEANEHTAPARLPPELLGRLGHGGLVVPPLRARPADIVPLASLFLSRLAPGLELSAVGHAALARYSWPGNVRELKLVVERAADVARGDSIGPDALFLDGGEAAWRTGAVRARLSLADLELQYIQAMLSEHDGHRGRTARALGIDPKTLYNKLGPQRPRRREP